MEQRDKGHPIAARADPDSRPRRFVFVLLDNFSLHCFASAIDSLRIANRMSGRRLYDWRLWSEGGRMVSCSAGTSFNAESDLGPLQSGDTVLLCGGLDIRAATTKPLLTWLRREVRGEVVVGGLCTAAYTLARAGLLEGRRATIHWENQDSFAEEFDDIALTKSIFVIDRGRLTTAGGTASIDLMLKLVADDHGEALAALVADQLIYSSIRTDQDTQRLSIPTRIGGRHPRLAQVIQMMEQAIEEPISPAVLARDVGNEHAPARAAVPPLPRAQPQALLHGAAPPARAQPPDADRHERDRGGAGLRLRLALALLEVLPRALRHHPLPRARRPGGPAAGLSGRPVGSGRETMRPRAGDRRGTRGGSAQDGSLSRAPLIACAAGRQIREPREMRRMTKLLAGAATAALLAGAASAQDDPVKLGILLGFTGPIESMVAQMAPAAEAAIAEINEAGTLLGGVTVEGVRADTACIDNAVATSAAERMIGEGVDGIIGGDCSA